MDEKIRLCEKVVEEKEWEKKKRKKIEKKNTDSRKDGVQKWNKIII